MSIISFIIETLYKTIIRFPFLLAPIFFEIVMFSDYIEAKLHINKVFVIEFVIIFFVCCGLYLKGKYGEEYF